MYQERERRPVDDNVGDYILDPRKLMEVIMKITLLETFPVPTCTVRTRGCSCEESKHIHVDRLGNACIKTPRKEEEILYQRLTSRFRNCLLVLGIRHGAQIAIGGYTRCVQP